MHIVSISININVSLTIYINKSQYFGASLSAGIICSEMRTVFQGRSSRKTVSLDGKRANSLPYAMQGVHFSVFSGTTLNQKRFSS